VPLTNGFVAKWLLFNAALADGLPLVVLAGMIGSLITAFSLLKATVSTFYGNPSAGLLGKEIHEAPPSMLAGMGVMGGLCLVFGVAPQVLMLPVVAPAVRSLGFSWDIGMGWLGVLTANGGVGMTVGAAAVVLALALSLLVYRLAQPPAAAMVSVFSGGEGLAEGDRPGAVDFAIAAEDAFRPIYSLDPDPLWLMIWAGIKRCAESAAKLAQATLERHPPVTIGVAAVVVLLGAWLVR
jgi:multicomponent K+:H+ antiporter subunit A